MASVARVNRGLMERLGRLSRLKLLIPLRRSPHSPEYSARGVAVGMFWALTPLVGIQMYLCLMTWLVVKPVKNLQFSLVISCAWTWVTNVFTMLPIYYVFYATGQIIRGDWHNITGYDTFIHSWHEAFERGAGFWQAMLDLAGMLAREVGLSMAIGCLPYAVLGTWLSYKISLKYIRRRRRKKLEKRIRQHASKDGSEPQTAKGVHFPDRPSA
ncbi:MAG: DUF2062 domain-containing protein [Rhodospirillales bacterium]|nr:DUF2062 domain-containing protein [Rhodospirillales bacterium]MBO6788063.1 DUF2062 domain-containing protein [Rhodospirillales bacterium]